ncbi:hypothetical protein GC194_01555 [bacterium]|nr:hypothetical protein [bacterium]
MKLKLSILALVLALSTANAFAQHGAYEIKPANPKDVESIEAIINALYEVISGEANEERDWTRFKSLWHPEAKLVMVTPSNDSTAEEISMDCDEFIKLSSNHGKISSFYEVETFTKTDMVGHIAQVLSTYVIKSSPDQKGYQVRGVNLFQLFFDGKRWWILNCTWENEVQGMKIPAQYLGN